MTTLLRYAGAWAVLAALAAVANAQTRVDIFQDMESGEDGDLLTPAVMNASSHGGGAKWTIVGKMWVSTARPGDLPFPVIVEGKTYAGIKGIRCWKFDDCTDNTRAYCEFADRHSKITIACYYTPGVTIKFGNQFDSIPIHGSKAYAVLQTTNEDGKGPYLRAHSCAPGWKTTFSPDHIPVVSGRTYWVNLKYDGEAGKVLVAVFDPTKALAQVGETVVADSTPGSLMNRVGFGRGGGHHGDNPKATTQSYYSDILIDYTAAAFPLIPAKEAQHEMQKEAAAKTP